MPSWQRHAKLGVLTAGFGVHMELGMIGLGRMGANMAERLVRGGHRAVGFDPGTEARALAASKGIEPVTSLEALVAALPTPRRLWIMVPAGQPVDDTLARLLPLLAPGDTVVEGGNSFYKDTMRRGEMLAAQGIHYVECGTLAPATDRGWARVGPSGSGHFTKMVHNGIEYGMMQAYAEGFAILQHKTGFNLDLHQVAEVWREGSVVRSWLLDLTADALAKNPTMAGIAPYVEDSGEGRWTVAEAVDLNVAAPVITLSLLERLRSRDDDSFVDKLLAAMRNQFGGHRIKTE